MENLHRLFTFLVLLLVQVLVLNHIQLFHCATPLLYVYLVLHFRRNYPRYAILLWSFFLGLSVDIFANTPGVAAASMTFVAFLQPHVMQLFVPRDAADDFSPSIRTMGFQPFLYYSMVMVFIYCLLFFTLETFSFFNWIQWLASVFGSFVITMIFLIVIENLDKKSSAKTDN
jgi:rod shape-determining protein MreD